MGKFTQSVRRIVQDVKDEGTMSGLSREEVIEINERLILFRFRLEMSYETAKQALNALMSKYGDSKSQRNIFHRYPLLKVMIKVCAVISLSLVWMDFWCVDSLSEKVSFEWTTSKLINFQSNIILTSTQTRNSRRHRVLRRLSWFPTDLFSRTSNRKSSNSRRNIGRSSKSPSRRNKKLFRPSWCEPAPSWRRRKSQSRRRHRSCRTRRPRRRSA